MNLIYMCVFHQESYIQLLKLLITSISLKGNTKDDILIITSPSFKPLIEKELESFQMNFQYYLLDFHTLFEAGCARLNIFNYEHIDKYDKILYLDTDILIHSDMNVLFTLDSEKMYTLEEGNIGHEYWGGQFFNFNQYDRNISAFTSGILLFKNCESIKSLFLSIQRHINYYVSKNATVPICLDQPFIVYNSITQNKYDNQVLKQYAENNPSIVTSKIIYHFPGGPGAYASKFMKMTNFWKKMNAI